MATLVCPVQRTRHGSQGTFGQWLDAVDGLEEQHAFLDIGGELQEREELRDARACDTESARRVGLVAELTAADRLGDLVGEREHDGHTCRTTYGCPRRWRLGDELPAMATLNAMVSRDRAGDALLTGSGLPDDQDMA
jgi:hypothetical protein